MKERPILFSAPMVRAILEGRKTQTRRLVKPVRGFEHNAICRPDLAAEQFEVWWHGESERVGCLQSCPYGCPGDRLWVREAWRVAECYDNKSGAELNGILSARNAQYAAAADQFLGVVQGRYRHARFMPRWASRITLEVTGVRVERLNEISEADARAEGCAGGHGAIPEYGYNASPVEQYGFLWEQINGPGSWSANPWVWVVEFARAAQAKEGAE
jgi:hypothetical protein